MEKVLVIGATGHCGISVTEELIRRGHSAVVLYRSKKPSINSPKIQFIQGDATNADDLKKALEGVTCIINCIGFGKGSGKPTTFFSDINRALLKAMKVSKTDVLVTMSNVGVFKTGHTIIYRFAVPIFMKWLKHIINDKEILEKDLLQEKTIRWACARFPNIVNGPAKPIKSDSDGKSLSLKITTESVANVLVDLFEDKEKSSVFLCYSN